MTKDEALKLALEALEKVTKEMLACRDALAERGCRPTSNALHQRLWDSSFDAYTNHAIPAAGAINEALAAPVQELNWYCVGKTGIATLCTDEDDAKKNANRRNALSDRHGPYRAVQLCEYTPPAQPAPVQEPVAWMWEQKAAKSSSGIGGWDKMILFCKPVDDPFVEKRNLAPLYTTPPAAQRPWVGLTDEDRVEIYEEHRLQIRPIIEIVEAKLREKNT